MKSNSIVLLKSEISNSSNRKIEIRCQRIDESEGEEEGREG